MKADPNDQLLLLELQEIDTALAQLAYRRANLPELAELAALERELSALQDELARVRADADDLDRDIARLERDIEQVRDRKDRDSARLAAGTGPARELEALQHEVESLTRRQTVLEDQELELMERREQVQGTIDDLEGRLADAQRRRAETEQRRDAALAEIAAEEEARRQARAPLAARLPADLVALYEKIRDDHDGVGAARLRGGRCGGCRLELSGSERARVRAAAPDEVIRCEECRRIMVRDAESGL